MLQHILLIRHAECLMNLHLSTTIGGRANDSPLTRRGRRQAELLARRLARLPEHKRPRLLFASTAVRARETAEAVARALSAVARAEPVPVRCEESLLEIEMGDWAGKDRKGTYTERVLAAIRADPANFAAPGGESQAQVEERVARCVESVVLPAAAEYAAKEAEASKTKTTPTADDTSERPPAPPALPVVAVVAHGVAIKVLLRRLIASDPHAFAAARNIALENTGISEIALDTSKARLASSCSSPSSSSSVLGCGDGANSSTSSSSWDRELWHLIRVNDAAHLEGMEEIDEEQEEEEEDEAVSSPRIDR